MSNHLSWRYRRLRGLAQRMRTSIALRGWRGTIARITQELRQRPSEDESLSLISLDAPFTPFALTTSQAPRLSIVIPIHGKAAYTVACLKSIAAAPPGLSFEVIVVDDASPDDSVAVLANVAGLRMLRNEHNLGFVATCNAGAAAALGEYLLFLNNDTQVTPGWAEALIACLETQTDAGIAGSRLVYPDGRLQEAGSVVFADGNAWSTGRFASRNDPAFRFTRQVDYVSGASLAIRRDLFNALGGFDLRYAPGYYEDTDLAFAARAAGKTVWCVPGSTVIHVEGASSAGEANEGMKRFQAINRQTFVTKWADVLAHQPAAGTPLAGDQARRARGTIWVVDVATPDASRDSGSLRLTSLMRLLVDDGWHVVFAPDDGHADDMAIRTLGALGIEVLARPWVPSLPTWLAKYGETLSAAILSRHTVASQYAALVRRHAPQARLIFDTVDLHFLREERAATSSGNGALARQAATTRKDELRLINEADATFVVSGYERDLLAKLAPSARIELVSNIHDVFGRAGGHAGRDGLLFIGGFGHPPNADAMHWMASEILPALRRRFPHLRISVAGDVPEAERRALASAGLDMLGRVADLEPFMASSLASIAPLRFGAGVKGKVNMAMSHGLPVLGTRIAVEGMHLRDGADVLIAETPDDFAEAYARLVADEALWMRLSDRGVENVETHFSPAAALSALRRAME